MKNLKRGTRICDCQRKRSKKMKVYKCLNSKGENHLESNLKKHLSPEGLATLDLYGIGGWLLIVNRLSYAIDVPFGESGFFEISPFYTKLERPVIVTFSPDMYEVEEVKE